MTHNNKNKFLEWFSGYFASAICIIVFILLLKIVELFFIKNFTNFEFITFVKAFVSNILTFGFLSLTILPIYAIIRFFSEKAALISCATIFSIIIVTEIGLTIFTLKSGSLMDGELFIRPINEIWLTIKNGIENLWLLGILFFLFIVIFCLCAYYINNKKSKNKVIAYISISIIGLSIPFIFFAGKLGNQNNVQVRNYIANKTWYLILSSLNPKEINEHQVDINEGLIDKYIKYQSGQYIPNRYFPMEHIDSTPDVLSKYFNESKEKPNIVFIIVESLGIEWMNTIHYQKCVTPFIDSLSKNSLYWENCLSSTPRSFGVVPATTGSVPCGVRGFQFGNMPKHNSIISILKNNGYKTNAFYAGLFYFDCVAEYLIAQKIDYMSDFYADYEKDNDKSKGCFWGYHDKYLFEKTIDVLNSNKTDSPIFNTIITISTHDGASEENPIFKSAAEKAKKIIGKNENEDNLYSRMIGFIYTDDALKDFFAAYSQREDFENTIFVITGDHSSGYFQENDISRYHVPLIIYSPLLKEHKKFTSIVTHNDIAPSLVALLKYKYKLNTPKFVSWAGTGLNTSEKFESKSEMLFVEYANGITKLLCDKYIYYKENNTVYTIDENMNLVENNDENLKVSLKDKFDTYKYIYEYSYLNNKLCSYPIYPEDKFEPITTFSQKDSLFCHTSEDKHWVNYYLLPETKLPSNLNFDKIKITITADVSFLDKIEADDYMDLYFNCSGENQKYPNFYTDKIVKFLPYEKINVGEWYKLQVSKEFQVTDSKNIKCCIYTYYSKWYESNRAVFKNINVKIEGIHQ